RLNRRFATTPPPSHGDESEIGVVVPGTRDAVVRIGSGGKLLPETVLADGIRYGRRQLQKSVPGAGDHKVELALVELAGGRVGHELPIDAANANGANRAQERNRADGEGRGCAVDGQDVGVVLLVRGEHGQDHLDVVAVALGEER